MTILKELGFRESLLLSGVSAWSLSLFYMIASRSVNKGRDDPRFEGKKREEGFWNRVFFSIFLPEAVRQALITLPFTAPFLPGVQGLLSTSPWGLTGDLALWLFGTDLAIGTFADTQLESHKQEGKGVLLRDGAWSIVRHPK